MSSPKSQIRFRPIVEVCEARVALSGAAANTLAVVPGTVQTPHSRAATSFPVSARNINRRHSIILGASIRANDGSGLIPTAAHAQGASGEPIPLRQGVPASARGQRPAKVYLRTGQPGPVTTDVTGRRGTTGDFELTATLPGDVDGDGQVTLADEALFVKAFGSRRGGRAYLPAADANQNGQVGQDDARFLLRNLRPLGPQVPLSLSLTLAPEDVASGPTPQVSGGATHHKNVTILGRTTPGSFVFLDSGLGDFSFRGTAAAADAQGRFAVQVTNREGLTNYNFLAIDPFGQQVIRVYPVYWLDFARSAP